MHKSEEEDVRLRKAGLQLEAFHYTPENTKEESFIKLACISFNVILPPKKEMVLCCENIYFNI